MTRGARFLAVTAMLGIAGCRDGGELQIRSMPAPISATAKPLPFRIAEANGHFLLGNIALALESYRKALRDEPHNLDAMVGLAACYDRMARFDLSRRYYESALAVAPSDTRILQALAGSLELQGRAREAGAVRSEIAARAAAANVPPVATEAPLEQQVLADLALASPPPSAPAPASRPAPEPAARPAPAPATVAGPSVTVALAPARPVAPTAPVSAVTAPAAVQVTRPPAPITPRTDPRATLEAADGVRLERMSLAEVILVTSAGPQWRPQLVRHTAQSSTVRFVPLKREAQSARVRLLNAARTRGLAARTRSLLQTKGWQQVAIGDAQRTRDRSLVLYSPATAQAAQRLARQFGFAIAREPRIGGLTVLLGRDAVPLARSRG